ncbi:hypothetical protein A6J81_25640 [Citrobacter braakii]|nr:hypothetical protein CU079_23725 [Citrobacter freundii]AVH83816.1 hypothetical protein A6J81_25640 [Citrobacter braakii]
MGISRNLLPDWSGYTNRRPDRQSAIRRKCIVNAGCRRKCVLSGLQLAANRLLAYTRQWLGVR